MTRRSGVQAPALPSCHCDPLCVVLQLTNLELLQVVPTAPEHQTFNLPAIFQDLMPSWMSLMTVILCANFRRLTSESSEGQSLV